MVEGRGLIPVAVMLLFAAALILWSVLSLPDAWVSAPGAPDLGRIPFA